MNRVVPFAGCIAAALCVACDPVVGPGAGEPIERLPRALSVSEQQVISASNDFAFDILRQTVARDTSPNVFLSPVSASMALGMTMNGARGATLDGMRSTLGFGTLELAKINESYRDLIDLLRGLDASVEMHVANSIWARSGFPFHQAFYDEAQRYFDAEVATLDFSASSAPGTINQWVDRSTQGKIRDIVPSPIPAHAVMYLINAIYFKGDWKHQFDAKRTSDGAFHVRGGVQKTVKMMHREGPIRYHNDGGTEVIELLYGREAFAMTIVLPPSGADVDALVRSMSPAQWRGWTDALQERAMPISMPRFRLEYETTMNDALIALGMGAAFGVAPGTDFSGLSPMGKDLVITNVKQKTYVDVNEEGTAAAAATSVEIGRTSMPQRVVVDRPFIVAIRERFSGTILFLGKVGAP